MITLHCYILWKVMLDKWETLPTIAQIFYLQYKYDWLY